MLISNVLSSIPPTLPRREAELLIAHTLGKPRAWVMAHPEAEINLTEQTKLEALFAQAQQGTPLPYLLGEWEFFGLSFKVSPDVLIPRPETELLVETVLSGQWTVNSIADIGTGSGIIAVTLATKLPHAKIWASDISTAALEIARANAQRHHTQDRITFVQGDLLEKIGRVDLICANLPYIPTAELENLEVTKHEPRLALDGGTDGLRLVERLLATAPAHLTPHGIILAEIAHDEGAAALQLAQKYFANAHSVVKKDLAGLDRLLVIGNS